VCRVFAWFAGACCALHLASSMPGRCTSHVAFCTCLLHGSHVAYWLLHVACCICASQLLQVIGWTVDPLNPEFSQFRLTSCFGKKPAQHLIVEVCPRGNGCSMRSCVCFMAVLYGCKPDGVCGAHCRMLHGFPWMPHTRLILHVSSHLACCMLHTTWHVVCCAPRGRNLPFILARRACP
jgi:hypothetical protein